VAVVAAVVVAVVALPASLEIGTKHHRATPEFAVV
jgi:hypothetical protein